MKEKMDIKQLIQKIGVTRFIVIVLAGIALLVLSLPSGSLTGSATADNDQKSVSSKDTQKLAWDATEQYIKIQEKETENILSKVQGIGKVDVMITLASSEEKVTMQDNDVSNDDTAQTQKDGESQNRSQYTSRSENVLIEQDGTKSPYVVQINSPKIEGICVVAKGAQNSTMKTEIIEAIQALFSIEAHKIKVMKME